MCTDPGFLQRRLLADRGPMLLPRPTRLEASTQFPTSTDLKSPRIPLRQQWRMSIDEIRGMQNGEAQCLSSFMKQNSPRGRRMINASVA
jgi:hypothetical protein